MSLVKDIAHYAIELNADISGPFRGYVSAVAAEIETGNSEALGESCLSLRNSLRDYRDKTEHAATG